MVETPPSSDQDAPVRTGTTTLRRYAAPPPTRPPSTGFPPHPPTGPPASPTTTLHEPDRASAWNGPAHTSYGPNPWQPVDSYASLGPCQPSPE